VNEQSIKILNNCDIEIDVMLKLIEENYQDLKSAINRKKKLIKLYYDEPGTTNSL